MAEARSTAIRLHLQGSVGRKSHRERPMLLCIHLPAQAVDVDVHNIRVGLDSHVMMVPVSSFGMVTDERIVIFTFFCEPFAATIKSGQGEDASGRNRHSREESHLWSMYLKQLL